jgi:hypothetical protein
MSVKEAIHESIPCVASMMRPLYERIDPLEVGGHRRALAIGEEYAKRLLSRVGNSNCEEIVEKLVWKYPSHDFIVDIDEALEIGLPVATLPREQEKKLIKAIMEVQSNERSFYGFVSPKSTPVPRPKPKRRSTRSTATVGRDGEAHPLQ